MLDTFKEGGKKHPQVIPLKNIFLKITNAEYENAII